MNISVHPVAAAAAHAQEQTQRRLTILAIGHAESTHVRARVGCFAARGHKVFLLTETGTESAIPGVTQLVPALDRSTWSGRVLAALTSLGLKVFGFSTEHAWRALAFLKFLRATRPDIVHVHFAYAYYGWMAALMGCRPLVVTVMGGDVLFEEQGAPIPHGKWLTLQLLRNADYITSKSNYLTAALHRFGGINGRIERIFWGIPLAELRSGDPDAAAIGARISAGSAPHSQSAHPAAVLSGAPDRGGDAARAGAASQRCSPDNGIRRRPRIPRADCQPCQPPRDC